MADTKGAVVEQPAETIGGALRAAFEEAEKKTTPKAEGVKQAAIPDKQEEAETEVEAEQPAEQKEEKEAKAPVKDEKTGKFVAKDKKVAAGESPGGTPETPAKVSSPSAVEPPAHWAQKDKDTFNKAPPQLRSWLLDRHKAMEADYTKKTQAVAELKREYEPVNDMFKPYMVALSAQGLTPGAVIKQWADTKLALDKNPLQTLLQIGKQYGLTPQHFAQAMQQNGQQPQMPEAFAPFAQKLTAIEQFLNQQQQQTHVQRFTQTRQTIEQFADEKDAKGNPIHPHFDDVVDDIIRLANVERAAGREPNLQNLYETAVWANPTTREKQLAAQTQQAQQKAQTEAKAKAAKARNAGSSVSGAPGPGGQAPLSEPKTLREAIMAAANQSGNA